jgi:hypothetical protein
MKAGPYCGFSLDEIIKIKQQEEKDCGVFFWGYGGVFCRPPAINAFVSHAKSQQRSPMGMFSTTKSSYTTSSETKFTQFSTDNSTWNPLPRQVLLVGNKTISHFAIVGKNLKKTKKNYLNLSDYCTFAGMLPDENRYLDSYFQYRVDKACGQYLPRPNVKEKVIEVNYSFELTDPYCVYIK